MRSQVHPELYNHNMTWQLCVDDSRVVKIFCKNQEVFNFSEFSFLVPGPRISPDTGRAEVKLLVYPASFDGVDAKLVDDPQALDAI